MAAAPLKNAWLPFAVQNKIKTKHIYYNYDDRIIMYSMWYDMPFSYEHPKVGSTRG